jgi:hypothetical protein
LIFVSVVRSGLINALREGCGQLALLGVHRDPHKRAAAAADAYAMLASVLRDEIAPHARREDAFGRDAYRLLSRGFLGTSVDLDETYQWGLAQLESIVAEQESIAHRLYPGASVSEALHRLDDEPRYLVRGTEALQTWMQDLSDRAVQSLGDKHFDIPPELRTLECRIAPTHTGGIYYTGPSEDLTRPGRMWWSISAACHWTCSGQLCSPISPPADLLSRACSTARNLASRRGYGADYTKPDHAAGKRPAAVRLARRRCRDADRYRRVLRPLRADFFGHRRPHGRGGCHTDPVTP